MTTLFPRKPGPSRSLQRIARAAAHRVLDRAKAGDISVWERIDWTLRVTGDLADQVCPEAADHQHQEREMESLHV